MVHDPRFPLTEAIPIHSARNLSHYTRTLRTSPERFPCSLPYGRPNVLCEELRPSNGGVRLLRTRPSVNSPLAGTPENHIRPRRSATRKYLVKWILQRRDCLPKSDTIKVRRSIIIVWVLFYFYFFSPVSKPDAPERGTNAYITPTSRRGDYIMQLTDRAAAGAITYRVTGRKRYNITIIRKYATADEYPHVLDEYVLYIVHVRLMKRFPSTSMTGRKAQRR